jgi:hypothetical protein
MEFLYISSAAAQLGASVIALRRWLQLAQLKLGIRTTAGRRRFTRGSIGPGSRHPLPETPCDQSARLVMASRAWTLRAVGQLVRHTCNVFQSQGDALNAPPVARPKQALLLFSYNQPDDGLLNDEFWWLAANEPHEKLIKEVEALLAAGVEWRRQLEASADSGLTIFDSETVRSLPVALQMWCIAAADELEAVRGVAHGLGKRAIPPDRTFTESNQVAPVMLELLAGEMLRGCSST